MRCPVCDALQREQSLMNQIEASTVLQQRYKMILPVSSARVQHHSDEDLEEMILFSRKFQARIAFRLQRHHELEHAA